MGIMCISIAANKIGFRLANPNYPRVNRIFKSIQRLGHFYSYSHRRNDLGNEVTRYKNCYGEAFRRKPEANVLPDNLGRRLRPFQPRWAAGSKTR